MYKLKDDNPQKVEIWISWFRDVGWTVSNEYRHQCELVDAYSIHDLKDYTENDLNEYKEIMNEQKSR